MIKRIPTSPMLREDYISQYFPKCESSIGSHFNYNSFHKKLQILLATYILLALLGYTLNLHYSNINSLRTFFIMFVIIFPRSIDYLYRYLKKWGSFFVPLQIFSFAFLLGISSGNEGILNIVPILIPAISLFSVLTFKIQFKGGFLLHLIFVSIHLLVAFLIYYCVCYLMSSIGYPISPLSELSFKIVSITLFVSIFGIFGFASDLEYIKNKFQEILPQELEWYTAISTLFNMLFGFLYLFQPRYKEGKTKI